MSRFNLCQVSETMRLFFLAIGFLQISLSYELQCGIYGRLCVSKTEYQTCLNINGVDVLTGLASTCPPNQICVENALVPCQADPNIPTTTTTTTTQSPIPTASPPPPTCTSEATYPGPQCNQYYHCIPVMWWWSYEILTCPTGQAYNGGSGTCVASATCVV